jgi:hypothetical protein
MSERNAVWIKLQQEFLRKTTLIPYRFSVFANGCDESILHNVDIIGRASYADHFADMSFDHLECLKQSVIKFDNSCEYYLILDSDCWPIQVGWHINLLEQMEKHDLHVAAPIRTENLDTFPHPCAMFMDRQGRDNLNLTLSAETANFLSKVPRDPTCLNPCFPMIRTNRVNMHPIGAAVYYDMFYHHGAGSRQAYFRVTDGIGYYQYPQHQQWMDTAYELLTADPDEFIKSLLTHPI